MRMIMANGLQIPALGQGGWNMGDAPQMAKSEMAALRRGLELGLALIDTAEMYGDGRSEMLIGNALRGVRREDYMLVSKVYPHNAGSPAIFSSCDASLKRLNTDYLDLYLLHWRGSVPLAETVACMEQLVQAGKIKRWGVSNFDAQDMQELWRIPAGDRCAVNQVLYHLGSRGIEYDLIPWAAAHGVAIMAYCPLAQAGRLKRMNKDILTDALLVSIAGHYRITVVQLLLAFIFRQSNVSAIPKAGTPAHVEENAAALDVRISAEDWARIDAVFWPPTAKMHLDIE
jgi:Aldo/keto reductases, related to diketogulonate reductase